MRNLTIADIRLHPSTTVDGFEAAMTTVVLPGAGDPLQHPETLFVRSLYRQADESFPPAYRCVVDSIWATGPGFFEMRDRIRDLGADLGKPRFRPMAGNLPDHAGALGVLRSGRCRGMVMLAVHLPFGQGEQEFETELLAALRDEVGVPTRVDNVAAAFWTRDDSVVFGNTEYLVVAVGDFMRPQLRDDTLARIAAAGGDVAEALPYHLVTTVPGPDPTPSDAPAAPEPDAA